MNFLKKLIPSKTTAAGIASLVAVGIGVLANPGSAMLPQTLAAVMAAFGLFAAKDAKPIVIPPSPPSKDTVSDTYVHNIR